MKVRLGIELEVGLGWDCKCCLGAAGNGAVDKTEVELGMWLGWV